MNGGSIGVLGRQLLDAGISKETYEGTVVTHPYLGVRSGYLPLEGRQLESSPEPGGRTVTVKSRTSSISSTKFSHDRSPQQIPENQ